MVEVGASRAMWSECCYELHFNGVYRCVKGTSPPSSAVTNPSLAALYPALRRFAAVVGPDEVEPDDLVHDALVATLSRISWVDLEHPASYIRAAIFNLASNHRRRLSRSREAAHQLERTFRSDRPDTYPSDLDELTALSPRARAVIYLRHIEGESYAEIGEALGLSEVHARVVASRALAKLRKRHKESTHEVD